jgi:hypothetical protein
VGKCRFVNVRVGGNYIYHHALTMFQSVKDHLQGIYLIRKGKAIPLQAWTLPEGSRRLRLTDF